MSTDLQEKDFHEMSVGPAIGRTEVADVLGITHFHDDTMLSATTDRTLLLLRAACKYLRCVNRLAAAFTAQLVLNASNRIVFDLHITYFEVYGRRTGDR